MSVSGQIDARRAGLSPAERRVAAVVADDPEAVAFGTVADLASRVGTSGATVMRLAAKLGYDGFSGLQAAVRQELAGRLRLRPAVERIREPLPGDVLERTLTAELENVAATLGAVEPSAFAEAVRLLSARRGRLLVLSGDASSGVAALLATELGMLRPGVVRLDGPEVAVARALADAGPADTVLALDLSRYDRLVVASVERAARRGVAVVAVTDSALSPLAAHAGVRFTVAAAGAGPFDSHVGVLALGNALVTGVASRLRRSATERLDRVEAAWREAGALVEGR